MTGLGFGALLLDAFLPSNGLDPEASDVSIVGEATIEAVGMLGVAVGDSVKDGMLGNVGGGKSILIGAALRSFGGR